MNMTGAMFHLTAMDVIVGLAVLFALVFLAAWLISPRLRAWVERPKYRFQANVRAYDQVAEKREEHPLMKPDSSTRGMGIVDRAMRSRRRDHCGRDACVR